MLTLYIGGTLDGLSVCNLLRDYLYGYAVSFLQLCTDDADLDISLTAQKGLVCLHIPFQYEGRIFFHQLVQALCHLLLILLLCRLNGNEVVRLREVDSRHGYCFRLEAQRIAGFGVLQLCQSHHIAGRNFRCVLLLLASYEEHGTQLLGFL